MSKRKMYQGLLNLKIRAFDLEVLRFDLEKQG